MIRSQHGEAERQQQQDDPSSHGKFLSGEEAYHEVLVGEKGRLDQLDPIILTRTR